MEPLWAYSLIVAVVSLLIALGMRFWYRKALQRDFEQIFASSIDLSTRALQQSDIIDACYHRAYDRVILDTPEVRDLSNKWNDFRKNAEKLGRFFNFTKALFIVLGGISAFFTLVNGAFDFYRNITGNK